MEEPKSAREKYEACYRAIRGVNWDDKRLWVGMENVKYCMRQYGEVFNWAARSYGYGQEIDRYEFPFWSRVPGLYFDLENNCVARLVIV